MDFGAGRRAFRRRIDCENDSTDSSDGQRTEGAAAAHSLPHSHFPYLRHRIRVCRLGSAMITNVGSDTLGQVARISPFLSIPYYILSDQRGRRTFSKPAPMFRDLLMQDKGDRARRVGSARGSQNRYDIGVHALLCARQTVRPG